MSLRPTFTCLTFVYEASALLGSGVNSLPQCRHLSEGIFAPLKDFRPPYILIIAHSYRIACTGSSRAARDAGYSPASRLTTMAKPMAAANSQGGTEETVSGGKSRCAR